MKKSKIKNINKFERASKSISTKKKLTNINKTKRMKHTITLNKKNKLKINIITLIFYLSIFHNPTSLTIFFLKLYFVII